MLLEAAEEAREPVFVAHALSATLAPAPAPVPVPPAAEKRALRPEVEVEDDGA